MSDTETQSLQSSRPQAAAKSEDMSQNISKKRSDEDISKDENKQPQSSVTLRGDVETANDLPTFNAANAQPELDSDIDQMPPPPRPASGEIKSSQRQAQSGQRLQDAQQSQTGSTQMMSSLNIESQTDKATADADPMDDASHSDDMDSSSSCHTADPHAELEAFDWIDLQQRYHDKVLELQTKEDSILQDFGLLCNVRLSRTATCHKLINSSTSKSGHKLDRGEKWTGASSGVFSHIDHTVIWHANVHLQNEDSNHVGAAS